MTDNHTHVHMIPARYRANETKVRYRCKCGDLGKWTKETPDKVSKDMAHFDDLLNEVERMYRQLVEEYSAWTTKSLHKAAKSLGITGYSRMRKPELVKAVAFADTPTTEEIARADAEGRS